MLHPDGLLQITGTFSSIAVHEGKGVFGVEVRLSVTDQPPYHATVQFGKCSLAPPEAIGSQECFGVSNLIVVPAHFDSPQNPPGEVVEFTLPAESGYGGFFRGLLTDKELTGTFMLASGHTLTTTMRRGVSHWDLP